MRSGASASSTRRSPAASTPPGPPRLAGRAAILLGIDATAGDGRLALRSGVAAAQAPPAAAASDQAVPQGVAVAWDALSVLAVDGLMRRYACLVGQIRLPRPRGGIDPLKTHRPRLHRPPYDPAAGFAWRVAPGVHPLLAIDIRPGGGRVVQDAPHRAGAWRVPDGVMGGGAIDGTRRDPELRPREIVPHRPGTAQFRALGANAPPARLHLGIRLEDHAPVPLPHQTNGEAESEVAAFRLVAFARMPTHLTYDGGRPRSSCPKAPTPADPERPAEHRAVLRPP